MANNIDLIDLTAIVGGGCGCTESDFSDYFIAKTSGIYITSLSSQSGESSWTPYEFRLGTSVSTDTATLTIQGLTSSDAIINVKSNAGSVISSIKPNQIISDEFTNNAGTITISSSGNTLRGNSELHGNFEPGTTNAYTLGAVGNSWSNVYTNNLNVGGTATIGTLALTNLTASGTFTSSGTTNITGPTTVLGDASGDAIGVTGTMTFNTPFTAASSAGLFDFNNNSITTTGTGTFATLDVTTGTIDTLTVTNAPSADTHAVRRTDVNVGVGTTFASSVATIAVTGGYITSAAVATASDLPDHALVHKTTTLTGSTPVAGGGTDPLYPYEIGAVSRNQPVFGGPIKLTPAASANDYTYATAENYFVVIENDETPDATGPVGQIIFRKSLV